nr:MAG TPA: hypothetical protein [Caudoviricetes sp.]
MRLAQFLIIQMSSAANARSLDKFPYGKLKR